MSGAGTRSLWLAHSRTQHAIKTTFQSYTLGEKRICVLFAQHAARVAFGRCRRRHAATTTATTALAATASTTSASTGFSVFHQSHATRRARARACSDFISYSDHTRSSANAHKDTTGQTACVWCGCGGVCVVNDDVRWRLSRARVFSQKYTCRACVSVCWCVHAACVGNAIFSGKYFALLSSSLQSKLPHRV